MPYDGTQSAAHRVVLESRKNLTVSGVEDVERFDDESIVLSTSMGAMVITMAPMEVDRTMDSSSKRSTSSTPDTVRFLRDSSTTRWAADWVPS